MCIIDLHKVKRVQKLTLGGNYIALLHFDETSLNHKTLGIPIDYLQSDLAKAICSIESGSDVNWKTFIRKHNLKHLLDG